MLPEAVDMVGCAVMYPASFVKKLTRSPEDMPSPALDIILPSLNSKLAVFSLTPLITPA